MGKLGTFDEGHARVHQPPVPGGGPLVRRRVRASQLVGVRVLIVDDEPLQALALALILNEEGLGTELASDGVQALARLADGQHDVVVLDVQMPRMSGPVLLERMRTLRPNLPAVLATGLPATDPGIVRALELPRVRYIGKPIEIDNLLGGIGELLGR